MGISRLAKCIRVQGDRERLYMGNNVRVFPKTDQNGHKGSRKIYSIVDHSLN